MFPPFFFPLKNISTSLKHLKYIHLFNSEHSFCVCVLCRHPVDLFVSEYYYIASEVLKSNPSLQFVQDPILREKMRKGMTLKQYTSYPHQHHDWHGASTNRQAFYLTVPL